MTKVLCLVAMLCVLATARVVRTPFGEQPHECVVGVPNGAKVEDHPDGSDAILVTRVDGSAYRHETPRVCVELAAKRATGGLARGGLRCNKPPCTCDSLPCNNWIDNAGAMNITDDIGGMSAIYNVPFTPYDSNNNQTLFYFIGAENTNGTAREGPSDRAILQPVLTYDPSGWCISSPTGWCFAAWYCCPRSLTVHSEYVQNVHPKSKWLGVFNVSTDGSEYTTSGVEVSNKTRATSLRCPRQGRKFNWADVTQEVYGMQSCRDFAEGYMTFDKTALWDMSYKPMHSDWYFTGTKPCNGHIFKHDDKFVIWHYT